MKKRRKSIKINPPKNTKESDVIKYPFHCVFPVHLHYKEGKETKDCYFKDEFDLKKYIKRYNLKPKSYIVSETEPRD